MHRRSALLAAVASAAIVLTVAAAPLQVAPSVATRPEPTATTSAATQMEANEQVVRDYLQLKDRAEAAQRAIVDSLRQDLDRKRVEFEQAMTRFDEARDRYALIVGPLPQEGIVSATDPRLPYDFALRRTTPGANSTSNQLSRKPSPSAAQNR